MINLLHEAGHTGLIVQITGEPGKGKTKMALSTGAPYHEIALINHDTKRALVNQILKSGGKFGYYRDAVAETRDMKEIATHMAYISWFDEIEALDPSRRRVIIIDPWEEFERTLKPMVEENPKAFRDYWSAQGKFKGPQQWSASHQYAADIFSRLSDLCEILIITSHLKNAYKAGVQIPGKQRPDNKVAVKQKADIRIWLRENAKSAVPIALMMKRGLMKVVENDGKFDLVNVLPKRLEPRDGDRDVWDVIKRYWNDPVDLRTPEPHEIPDEFELSILEGTLTEDQQNAWKMEVLNQAEMERELEEEMEVGKSVEAKRLRDEEGKTPMEIKEELKATLPEVIGWLKGD